MVWSPSTPSRQHSIYPEEVNTGCKRILAASQSQYSFQHLFSLAGPQMVDQLPALPQCQLELTQVALDSFFAPLHAAEQGVEGVRALFSFVSFTIHQK